MVKATIDRNIAQKTPGLEFFENSDFAGELMNLTKSKIADLSKQGQVEQIQDISCAGDHVTLKSSSVGVEGNILPLTVSLVDMTEYPEEGGEYSVTSCTVYYPSIKGDYDDHFSYVIRYEKGFGPEGVEFTLSGADRLAISGLDEVNRLDFIKNILDNTKQDK
ncbi:hypothetical protein CR956_00645 [Candidatus Saccharibacteria bacterium]|nr:MAG: hypothetical protein CR956_00645 [Candidatus Saccharibacteria bacterium]